MLLPWISTFKTSPLSTDVKNSEKITGNIKSKILKSNLKSNFTYDNKSIDIDKFFFRDKKVSPKTSCNGKKIEINIKK